MKRFIPYLITLTLISAVAYGAAVKSLQADRWLSSDLTKIYTPPSITTQMTGVSDTVTIYNKTFINPVVTSPTITTGIVSGSTIRNPTIENSAGAIISIPASSADTFVILAGAQRLTNKTIASPLLEGNWFASGTVTVSGTTILNSTVSTSTIVVNDDVLTIQDNTTPTKKVQFQVSGLTAATTRVFQFPDFSNIIATTSGTETLTNKTVSTSTIIVNDDVFTVQDNSTPTKKLQLQLSGISAGTTRTITIPDASDTMAVIGTAQTYTAIPNLNAGVTASGTITFNNNIVFANTKGLDFSATANVTSGTTTSEIFNDAEYGTWTPELYGTTTAGAGTYSIQTGNYILNNNSVIATAYMTWSAHTGAGNMNLRGLPFLAFSTSNQKGGCAFNNIENVSVSASTQTLAYVQENTNVAGIVQVSSGAGANGLALDTAGSMIITCMYRKN